MKLFSKADIKGGVHHRLHFIKSVYKYRGLLLMLLPGILFFIIFHYIPMYGVLLAFKDFRIMDGIMASPWVGLKHFQKAFSDPYFLQVFKNSLLISIYKHVWGFPAPILFALLLNEVINQKFKKLVQTVSYLPYFLSWVVVAGMFINILSLNGPINAIISILGFKPRLFLTDPTHFRSILVITDIWKGFGWGSIIYLAAISDIEEEMYESAYLDGANRFQRAFHITIPSLAPVIVIVLILSCSSILNAGFDQVFNLYNSMVMDVSDIIDTYVYRKGLLDMDYSYATAVGVFKSIVALILIIGTNKAANKLGGKGYGLW
ncbi:MAG: sugar ABC transporter permease [Firmicutes bacterium]|nr:sugar ABC transporter permease [Bacillota bacterium]